MDRRFLDRARRDGGPAQADLIDALAKGRLSRRDFVKRGALLGMSVPFMGAVLAACGSDSDSPADTTAAPADTTAAETTPADTAAGDTTPADTAAPDTAAAAAGGVLRVASQKPAGPLDPIAMQDLGSYGVTAQCFEYLCTLGDTGDIGPGLAESWEPNADGSEWTFKLRAGVKWQNGADFSGADVAATMDRLVEAGNAGLKGVIEKGAVTSTDATTAVFKLVSANGNFPYLVSVFNPQSLITPAAYAAGTTLDKQPDGTGPWKLESYDPAGSAKFVRNDAWWGGKTPLDGNEWKFFDDLGAQITAVQGGAVEAIVQFQVIGGDALFNDPNFNVVGIRSAAHRQIWMRVDKGTFADKKVRQALALSIDRDALVQTLFKGKADIGNDHVIAPLYPFFNADAPPQRTRDVDAAKALLAEAGVATPVKAVLHVGQLQEIPDLAALIQSSAKDAGFEIEIASESLDTFYGAQWCPAEPKDPPCSGAAELGVVDYGHRSVPDVYLNAALATKGIWNSSQYMSPEFDAAFKEYQSAIGVDAQKAAVAKLQNILHEDVPVIVPYFYNYITGHTKKVQGVRTSALGQMFLDKASFV